ncbi:hypothetical protein EXIGLDRAFT_766211 [Exidia glandulosa HHB12029]|uniref:Uncharacterized protein n=1 Tax=Exidia glandulosa HHB12029 TaxID=1314781 RepID=A0A165JVP8_EXIGL|nr:hypothetical protein EXIGLDRAFT_766211 [Exidia glandulosa HHB12029]
MSRRDNAAAASTAGTTLRRTRDTQVKVYSTYILSTSALTVDIVTAYESIKTWGIPQPSAEVRDTAAYLMAVCNLGTIGLEGAMSSLNDPLSSEPPARSKVAKDVLMANYMAKMYNLICPVDSRDHQTMICVQIATKLLMEGPSLQAGFMDREIEHLLVDYKQASTVASRVWVDTWRSFLVPMIDTILANRESGWRALTPTSRAADWLTWGNSVESFTWTRSFPERQIQRLMSHVHGTEPRTIRWHELPIEVLTSLVTGEHDTLELHRCASCRAYSASLRRLAASESLPVLLAAEANAQISPGIYRIGNLQTQQILASQSGGNIQGLGGNGASGQAWFMTPASGGQVTIQNAQSLQFMSISGAPANDSILVPSSTPFPWTLVRVRTYRALAEESCVRERRSLES